MQTDKRQHLLVVDDEESVRVGLQTFFTRRGFDVTIVEGVEQTKQAIQQTNFDAVILDILLSDGDGLELLAQIKASHPSLPVIIITGLGFQEDLLQRAQTLGARGFVSKTLPPAQILMEVKHALLPRNG
jgi:DNA-binding NtrC family response regulator